MKPDRTHEYNHNHRKADRPFHRICKLTTEQAKEKSMKLDLFKYSTKKACDIIKSLEYASEHGELKYKVRFVQIGIGTREYQIVSRIKDTAKMAELKEKLESYLWTLGVPSDRIVG